MPYDPPPELAALPLAEIARLVASRKLPPLDQWRPSEVGGSHMEILANGRWYHEGGEITRPAMVRTFATLLQRDADGLHWLCTPSQKLRITVEDAPFIAVDVVRKDDALVFRLNTDDVVIAGPDHPVIATGNPDIPALYVTVRNGCLARFNRSTYSQIIEMALESGDLAVTSQGRRFSLVPE